MKKAIVIASAYFAILLFALACIEPTLQDSLPTIGIIMMLANIIISLLVIFDINLPKTLRIPLIAVSTIVILFDFALFYPLLSNSITNYYKDKLGHGIFILGSVAVFTTLFTYIIRTLRLIGVKENKISTNKVILILIGITCAVVSALAIIRHNNYTYYHSINGVLERLNSKDASIRADAVLSLVEFNDKQNIPVIRKLLKDEDIFVRQKAIYALGKLDDKESIPIIRQMLKDKDAHCMTPIVALAELNDKESIPLIKEFLKDENEYVPDAAENALKKLGVPEDEIEQAKQK